MCFPGKGTQITRDMCFPNGGTHIIRDMCFAGGGTQITSKMCFLGGEKRKNRNSPVNCLSSSAEMTTQKIVNFLLQEQSFFFIYFVAQYAESMSTF